MIDKSNKNLIKLRDLVIRVLTDNEDRRLKSKDFNIISETLHIDKARIKTIKDAVGYVKKSRSKSIQQKTADDLAKIIGCENWADFLRKLENGTTVFLNRYTEHNEKFSILEKALITKYSTSQEFNQILIPGDISGIHGFISMDECYMELSYLEREDIKARENLITREKESFRSKVTRNSIPHLYVSDSILSKGSRVVIMGNPGTGKTIFARWLCYNWAKNYSVSCPIPLYINLKRLNFSLHTDCLVEYLSSNYFKKVCNKVNDNDLLGFIRQENVVLILDGLDELMRSQKIKLSQELSMQELDGNYILLSRPYGLMDNPFLQNAVLEIIGYNEDSRFNYITKLLADNNKNYNNNKDLIDLIDSNPVLNDLSFNPLMLSYIVLLYLTEENSHNILSDIESSYHLQVLVLRWFKNAFYKKKLEREHSFNELLNGSEQIAGFMELNQQFIYHNKKDVDHFALITDNLSKIGIGRREPIDNDYSWRFYFTTVTFQEFLAAKHIGKTITPEAFFYVSRNQFFWNYTKMILGHKAYEGDIEFIKEVLEVIESKFLERGKVYYKFFQIFLLSEVSPNQINTIINPDLIAELISYTEKGDWQWESIVQESIVKIFTKMDSQNQKALLYEVIIRLNSLSQSKEMDYVELNILNLCKLIDRLRVHNNLFFIDKLFVLINSWMTDGVMSESFKNLTGYSIENQTYGDREYRFDLLKLLLGNCLTFLEMMNINTVHHFSKEILQLKHIAHSSFKDKLIRISISIQNGKQIQRDFIDVICLLSGEQENNIDIELVLNESAQKIYKYAYYYRYERDSVKNEIVKSIYNAQNLIEGKLFLIKNEDSKSNIMSWLLAAYADLNSNHYEYQSRIIKKYLEMEDIRIYDAKSFLNYLDKSYNSFKQQNSSKQIDHLFLTAIQCSIIGRHSFSKYRGEIYEALTKFIKSNHVELNEIYSESKASDNQEEYLISVSISNKISQIFDLFLIHNTNKKYFLERSIYDPELIKNNYVRCILIPISLSYPVYISPFKDLISKITLEDNVSLITENIELYEYCENIPFFETLLLNMKEISLNTTYTYLIGVRSNNYKPDELLLKKLACSIEAGIAKYKDYEPEIIYLTTLILFHFTNDNKIATRLNLKKKYYNFILKKQVIDDLIELFSEVELRKYEKVLGDIFFKEVMESYENQRLLNQEFEKTEFEKLLLSS